MRARILIAGFGNLLLRDDGFGVTVVKKLKECRLPEHVDVIEIGIGGMDLIYKLMDGYEMLVIVDAACRGKEPGCLNVFTPTDEEVRSGGEIRPNPHITEPLRCMQLARRLGVLPERIRVIVCEPADCSPGLELSAAVEKALEPAVEQIQRIIRCPSNDSKS